MLPIALHPYCLVRATGIEPEEIAMLVENAHPPPTICGHHRLVFARMLSSLAQVSNSPQATQWICAIATAPICAILET